MVPQSRFFVQYMCKQSKEEISKKYSSAAKNVYIELVSAVLVIAFTVLSTDWTKNLAKRYDAWDFEHDSNPQLYGIDLDVRYVFEMDEKLDVGQIDPNLDPEFAIASIDSVTFPSPNDWAERIYYRNYRKVQ